MTNDSTNISTYSQGASTATSGRAAAQFIDVVLPVPLNATFTYRVPDDYDQPIGVGYRVIVPFGRRRFYTGIVIGIKNEPPRGIEIKDVMLTLDQEPIIRYPQLKFWQWIADYYMSSLGDVYKAAIPAGLKVESETFVELNPDIDFEDLNSPLTEREETVMRALTDKRSMSVEQLAKATGLRSVEALTNSMLERGLVVISEKIVERYRARREKMVRLAFDSRDHDAMRQALMAVKGAKKQETALIALIEMSGAHRLGHPIVEVPRKDLLDKADVTTSIVKAMAQKGVIELYDKEINRFAFDGSATIQLPTLSAAQQTALDEIHRSFVNNTVTLLHGVTASGKTEIYINLIDFVLRQGNQALMLVPEIALTTQLTQRLQRVFGSRVVVYHSRFTDNERVDLWRRLLNSSEPCVVLGARSSIFMPFTKLGLVIVDEEHESSYKQYDPAPRYNARDAAIVLAQMHGAKVLLGSATPSIETYYKTEIGRWKRVDLSERYDNAQLPEIEVVDLGRARKAKTINGTFDRSTVAAVNHSLADGRQAILFHNRRGYAPMVRCKECAWVPKCQHCDVSLTVHRRQNALVCHYCGAIYPIPNVCPQCHEHSIDSIGYGTERIEEEVEALFPNAKMLRMDLDSTRNKEAYENIITQFSQHKADLLVGTQMVTKGLDFGDVDLVGVLNADAIIHFPDFRSTERAFNMLSQVSGRAGRREDVSGRVIVQTSEPSHPVINFLLAHDYRGYYDHELNERRQFLYPPFTRMIYIYLRHRDPRTLDAIASAYGDRLRQLLGSRVFGPEEPAVGRVQSLYIRKFMVKIETSASPAKVKAVLRGSLDYLYTLPDARGTLVHFDVDPM